MISLRGLFAGPERDFAKAATSKEKAARILKISPEALEAFEEAYRKGAMMMKAGKTRKTQNRLQKKKQYYNTRHGLDILFILSSGREMHDCLRRNHKNTDLPDRVKHFPTSVQRTACPVE